MKIEQHHSELDVFTFVECLKPLSTTEVKNYVRDDRGLCNVTASFSKLLKTCNIH